MPLPGYFAQWEDIIDELPELIKSREVRNKVRELPLLEVNEENLQREEDWWRAYVVTTFIGQAYIWMDKDDNDIMHSIPKCIAVPWCAVSEHLGMPPVVTYATACLYNWYLRDPTKPPDGDNLYSQITFTGTEDESWFYIVCLLVEIEAVPGMAAMLEAYSAIERSDNQALQQHLKTIKASMHCMLQKLNRMRERCSPDVFYYEFRRFQRGSKNQKYLPNNMTYEGVDPENQSHCGASAAQSSTLSVFDIFLGVEHTGRELEFLKDQRKHMPSVHCRFLAELEKRPPVREYIKAANDLELIQSFNAIADELTRFRQAHLSIVKRYIVKFLPDGAAATGTGGTELKQFLCQVKNDTPASKLL